MSRVADNTRTAQAAAADFSDMACQMESLSDTIAGASAAATLHPARLETLGRAMERMQHRTIETASLSDQTVAAARATDKHFDGIDAVLERVSFGPRPAMVAEFAPTERGAPQQELVAAVWIRKESGEADERQDRYDHDDKPDQIDDAVHRPHSFVLRN